MKKSIAIVMTFFFCSGIFAGEAKKSLKYFTPQANVVFGLNIEKLLKIPVIADKLKGEELTKANLELAKLGLTLKDLNSIAISLQLDAKSSWANQENLAIIATFNAKPDINKIIAVIKEQKTDITLKKVNYKKHPAYLLTDNSDIGPKELKVLGLSLLDDRTLAIGSKKSLLSLLKTFKKPESKNMNSNTKFSSLIPDTNPVFFLAAQAPQQKPTNPSPADSLKYISFACDYLNSELSFDLNAECKTDEAAQQMMMMYGMFSKGLDDPQSPIKSSDIKSKIDGNSIFFKLKLSEAKLNEISNMIMSQFLKGFTIK